MDKSQKEQADRLQAVKNERARLESELLETINIRTEATAVNDPELVAECQSAETRLQELIEELAAEATRLQKQTGAGALRARLQKLKTSEARARSVLGGGELPYTGVDPTDTKHTKDATPLEASGPPTAAGAGLVGPLPALSLGVQKGSDAPMASVSPSKLKGAPTVPVPSSPPSPTPSSSRSAVPVPSVGPQLTPRTAAATLPLVRYEEALPLTTVEDTSAAAQKLQPSLTVPEARKKEASSVEFEVDFGPPNIVGKTAAHAESGAHGAAFKPAANPPAGGKADSITHRPPIVSEASLENNPGSSCESFADIAFNAPLAASKAPSKSTGSSPKSKPMTPASSDAKGFGEATIREQPELGFGESAFVLRGPGKPGQESQAPGKGPGAGVPIEQQGKSISLRDSYLAPTLQNKGDTESRPQAEAQGSTWQAFDTSPKKPIDEAAPQLRSTAAPAKKDSGGFSGDPSWSAGFGAAAFGGGPQPGPPRSMTISPTPSARSGNPFQDFADPDDRSESGLSNPFSSVGKLMNAQNWPSQVSIGGNSADAFGPTKVPQREPPQPSQGDSFPAFPDPFTTSEAPQQQPLGGQQGIDSFAAFDPFAPAAAGPVQPVSSSSRATPPTVSSNAPGDDVGFGVPKEAQAAGSGAAAAAAPHLHSHFPGNMGHHFVATPSVVIPEADWEAAFAPVKPAQASVEEPAEDIGDKSVWAPMTDHDRMRCKEAFTSKFKGEEKGGVDLSQAQDLYKRAEIVEPLERVFAVSDLDSDGRLRFPEFLLFMYLLKVIRKGGKMPQQLTHQRIAYLLGVDIASLAVKSQVKGADESRMVHVNTSTSDLQTLISMGASEEEAKRALFLNGDDLSQAKAWLAERQSLSRTTSNIPSVANVGASSPVQSEGPSSGSVGPRLAIKIEKALLHYKKQVDRPIFQVVLRDAWGEPVEALIDTPPCQYDKGIFTAGHTVVLKTPVTKVPDGSVVYIELKHWKSKERKWSTLGWTFAPKESFIKLVDGAQQVRTEAQGLHLYEKPMDHRSHYRQGSMRKLKVLGEAPDLFLRVFEAPAGLD